MAVDEPVLRRQAQAALHPTRAWYLRRPIFALATFVIVLCGGVGFGWRTYVDSSSAQTIAYKTMVGQLRTVELHDGTSLVLDTDSAVTLRYTRNQRVATLARGRVQFSVEHDPGRPFIVHAGNGTVRDLGTVFQVSRDAKGVNVTLLRGAVSVFVNGRASGITGLRPGESLHYSPDGEVSTPRAVYITSVTGWTHGNLVVHDWPLSRLVRAMNRYSAVKLKLGDPAMGSIRISGVFRAGDEESLMRMLRIGWAIRSKHVSAQEVVLAPFDPVGPGGPASRR